MVGISLKEICIIMIIVIYIIVAGEIMVRIWDEERMTRQNLNLDVTVSSFASDSSIMLFIIIFNANAWMLIYNKIQF